MLVSKLQLGEQPTAWTLDISRGASMDDMIRVTIMRGSFALKACFTCSDVVGGITGLRMS